MKPTLLMKTHFPISVHWSAEDGEWVATSPAWPGLSSLDEDPVEALRGLEVVMELAAEANAEAGRPVPEAPLLESLKHAAGLLNLSALASLAGMRTQTLHSKLRRSNALSTEETASIMNALAGAGLSVAR